MPAVHISTAPLEQSQGLAARPEQSLYHTKEENSTQLMEAEVPSFVMVYVKFSEIGAGGDLSAAALEKLKAAHEHVMATGGNRQTRLAYQLGALMAREQLVAQDPTAARRLLLSVAGVQRLGLTMSIWHTDSFALGLLVLALGLLQILVFISALLVGSPIRLPDGQMQDALLSLMQWWSRSCGRACTVKHSCY